MALALCSVELRTPSGVTQQSLKSKVFYDLVLEEEIQIMLIQNCKTEWDSGHGSRHL